MLVPQVPQQGSMMLYLLLAEPTLVPGRGVSRLHIRIFPARGFMLLYTLRMGIFVIAVLTLVLLTPVDIEVLIQLPLGQEHLKTGFAGKLRDSRIIGRHVHFQGP